MRASRCLPARCAIGLVLVLVAAVACHYGSPIDEHGTPIAWVDGDPIMLEDLRGGGPLETREQRVERVDAAIADFVAAREARRRGLGFTQKVVRELAAIRRGAEVRERRLLRRALYDVVAWEAVVSEEEIREYFEAHKALGRRRLVTLRVTPFASEAAARRAAAAETVESTDGAAPESTEIGPLVMRELPEAVREAAKSLDAPGARGVAPVDGRWSIVELLAEERGEPPSFERARESVETRLRLRRARELFAEELASLRAASQIRIEDAILEVDAIWTPGSGPPPRR